ncbi:MAG: GntR family transcriptional regulator [Sterolibacterium sp.]|jgi:GntR family transcriptional regulator
MKRDAFAEFKPDAGDSSPLYLQLARTLGHAVRDGRYQVNQALPSERTLSAQLRVSRVTARKAIDRLVDEGLIQRRRGSGNYIAPRLEQPLSRLSSFSEELKQRGYTPGSRWLERSIRAATAQERQSLGLGRGARVAHLERLRLANEAVMAYEISVLPLTVLPDPSLVRASLYRYLERSGHAPVRAQQHLQAVNAPDRLAAQLGIPAGQAVLFITRVGYGEAGQAVELTHSYCRNDYYDFMVELRREVHSKS